MVGRLSLLLLISLPGFCQQTIDQLQTTCPKATVPKIVRKVAPKFPPNFPRANHSRNTVVLDIVVGENGESKDFKVLSSANPDLDQAAMEAVAQWRFAPATCDQRPVAVKASVEVNFQMGQGSVRNERAERGRTNYNLGIQYYLGKDLPLDFQKALRRLEEADKLGFPDAARILALMHQRGEGVPQDLGKAVALAEKSATAGSLRGQLLYAEYLRDGVGGSPQLVESAKWYRKAAEGGSADGMQAYAMLLEQGKGVAQDPKEAAKWREKATKAAAAKQ